MERTGRLPLKRLPQLNKLSLNNLIRHSTKAVTAADVHLPHLTLTELKYLKDILLVIIIWSYRTKLILKLSNLINKTIQKIHLLKKSLLIHRKNL